MSGYICSLCPRGCMAIRGELEGGGFCRAGTSPVVAHYGLHTGEEPCITGACGAGTVFFSGCSLGCVFCQNAAISRAPVGKAVSPAELSEIFFKLVSMGASCIDLVTPTHFTPWIRQALLINKPPVPVVWNSSGYESVDTLRTLEGLVDVYMPDLKYCSSEISQRYSTAPDYFEAARLAISEMLRQTGSFKTDGDGRLLRGVLVRHLVLPSHLADTRRVLDFLAKGFEPGSILVSLMGQYVPMGDAGAFPEIARKLGRREYRLAEDYMLSLGIEDGFCQSLASASESFVPARVLNPDGKIAD